MIRSALTTSSALVRRRPLHYEFSALTSIDWWSDTSTQFTARSPPPAVSTGNAQGIPCFKHGGLNNYTSSALGLPRYHQIRFRRHDRASAFSKPRPKTKKQQQAYNRRMKKISDERAKHSAPGSKAGPNRQWMKERWQQLLDHGKDQHQLTTTQDDVEYGLEDALMEDILGNTSHYTSQPTPEPVYLGHLHRNYYNLVADQMDRFRAATEAQSQQGPNDTDHPLLDLEHAQLPSDTSISDVLRAYRDRHGTRNLPIGVMRALEHLLKDLGVPIAAFGEMTYTSLLTCCRTPNEARRIFKLMNDQSHPVSAYSWSILVDIHAKLGDFEGCEQVMKEMASNGVPPTQPAYTSLLAACYKVCNDGRIPHSIRAKAGHLGWRKWQEMRIIGIEPDEMAYGAIIRLCAARGQAERAINLLEDMYRFDVKPTTLCFSSALRAVAKSHEIGIRFERGSSRKQLRRESMAAHHGKMARQILIMAENAEVEQDDGFVSALMLCAAAAGDSATAKAVYLAAEVRRMDNLRTIGSDAHLNRLRGEKSTKKVLEQGESILALQDGLNDKRSMGGEFRLMDPSPSGKETSLSPSSKVFKNGSLQSFGEREYGKDTRQLSALLRSCAQAIDKNGVGSIWAGKQNEGYLCDNSLRLITTRWEPSYVDNSIPGTSSTQVGIGALKRFKEEERYGEAKKGVRRKFRGLYIDDDAALTTDDLEDEFGEEFFNKDGGEGDFLLSETFLSSGATDSGPIGQCAQSFEVHNGNEDDVEKELNLDRNSNNVGRTEEYSYPDQSKLREEAHGDSQKSSDTVFSNAIKHDFPNGAMSSSDGEVKTPSGGGCETPFSPSGTLKGKDDTHSSSELEEDSSLLDFDRTGLSSEEIQQIVELRQALPGLPLGRTKRVVKEFNQSLSSPSLLTLVPILRETMPDYVSSGWLKKHNLLNAEFVLDKASEQGLVDVSLLNSMLQLKTNLGSLDEALRFHDEEFRKYKLKPTEYSDRLVVQMLVANGRVGRALAFKHKVEGQGRNIDIPSYGALVDYFASHEQVGSALMFLKECIASHGAIPGEKDLRKMRMVCRQRNLTEELRLNEMLGEDPIEWLRYGEKFLKREMSMKGRRDIKWAQNKILQA